MKDSFNKTYFIGGAESNYIDYRQKDYTQLALDLKSLIKFSSRILDYGCGMGNLVKAMSKDFFIVGTDISEWAIENGREFNNLTELELMHYDKHLLEDRFNVVLFLDVLEHCKMQEINNVLNKCRDNASVEFIVVRIPVAKYSDNKFLLECSKKDKTHIQCHDKIWWYSLFHKHNFEIHQVIHKKRIYDTEGVLAWVLRKKVNQI